MKKLFSLVLLMSLGFVAGCDSKPVDEKKMDTTTGTTTETPSEADAKPAEAGATGDPAPADGTAVAPEGVTDPAAPTNP